MSQIDLNNVSTDFESLLAELRTDLQQKGTWQDFLLSSTGTTLLEYIASIGVFNQYNIEFAFRETLLHKAQRESSVYGIARMLGIFIPRKVAPVVSVELSNIGTNVIHVSPKSFFISTNGILHNLSQINMAPGQVAPGQNDPPILMREGTYKSKTFPVSLVPFNEYFLGEPGFVVTDTDLVVYVRDISGSTEIWHKAEAALWMYGPTDKIYIESTTENGDVSIVFGDGVYGMQPSRNSTIIVNYIVTDGLTNISSVGTNIVYQDDVTLVGTIKSYYASGANEKSIDYYKVYGPHLFKSRDRAVTKTDYAAIILSHRDVADVTIKAQRDTEETRKDPLWMNKIMICILARGPQDDFGNTGEGNSRSAKWQDFLDWLQPKMGWISIQPGNPTAKPIAVNVSIAMLQTGDKQKISDTAKANILKLFEKDYMSLGKSIYISDLTKACTMEGVDYVVVNSPSTDVKPGDQFTFISLDTTIDNPRIEIFYSERTSLPTYTQ